MLTVLVQVSLAMSARSAADVAVAAAARRAALPGANEHSEGNRLRSEVQAIVPGAAHVTATVAILVDHAVAEASFQWRPPGPVLTPITIRARAEVPRASPP